MDFLEDLSPLNLAGLDNIDPYGDLPVVFHDEDEQAPNVLPEAVMPQTIGPDWGRLTPMILDLWRNDSTRTFLASAFDLAEHLAHDGLCSEDIAAGLIIFAYNGPTLPSFPWMSARIVAIVRSLRAAELNISPEITNFPELSPLFARLLHNIVNRQMDIWRLDIAFNHEQVLERKHFLLWVNSQLQSLTNSLASQKLGQILHLLFKGYCAHAQGLTWEQEVALFQAGKLSE
jgi:hypothetical protein